MTYRPAPHINELGDEFYDAVEPARFGAVTQRFRNQAWAAKVGLDGLDDAAWEDAFARFSPLDGNLPGPLALRYHGHQFRTYNPALGDGRGFLFAQLRDDADRLLDLGTKGSGQTPWSRGGDGRLTLKGGVREVLATEMLETLGVDTSKTFSLFETNESLHRNDEPSPTRASVMVRLSHSHIRFGTFQRLAFHQRRDAMTKLVAYCVRHYGRSLCHLEGEDAATALLAQVVERSAILCAQWMAAGFVHGVLNTDNMNLTGESFDYGPYRFLPTFDPTFTAAYFDHSGLYAYGNQPSTVQWNLHQLASALSLVVDEAVLGRITMRFEQLYADALDLAICHRLELVPRAGFRNRPMRRAFMAVLAESGAPFEDVFFDWRGGPDALAMRAPTQAIHRYETVNAKELRRCLEGFAPIPSDRRRPADAPPLSLLIDEIESIWSAIDLHDDWGLFEAKIAAIRAHRATPVAI